MHSKLRNKIKMVVQLWGLYVDNYTPNYSRVKPENTIKLKHYMHN